MIREDERGRRYVPALGYDGPLDLKWAGSPSDALQLHADLMRTSQRMHQYLVNGGVVDDAIALMFASETDWIDWLHLIEGIDIFYWTRETAALVVAASQTYPLELESAITLEEARRRQGAQQRPPNYFPKRPRGMAVFSDPCLSIRINGRPSSLSALIWTCAFSRTHREFWLVLRGVHWAHGNIAAPCWWADGGTVESVDAQVDEAFAAERVAFVKWVCTAAMFIEQEIVSTDRITPHRALRRRAERANLALPNCHVVTLRREVRADETLASETIVEWSHRWIVRGHWRRQFFPSRGNHAPVWIDPYIKGPDDKPFIEPARTVYAVTR